MRAAHIVQRLRAYASFKPWSERPQLDMDTDGLTWTVLGDEVQSSLGDVKELVLKPLCWTTWAYWCRCPHTLLLVRSSFLEHACDLPPNCRSSCCPHRKLWAQPTHTSMLSWQCSCYWCSTQLSRICRGSYAGRPLRRSSSARDSSCKACHAEQAKRPESPLVLQLSRSF